MALRFKIEKHEKYIRFRVKGSEIELSYHAASALCNAIMETCWEKLEANTNKRLWWLLRAKKGIRCHVRDHNRHEYEDFLKAHGIDIESLRQSNLGHTNKHHIKREKPKHLSYEEREEQRMARQRAKVEELRKRHHIDNHNDKRNGNHNET